MSENRLIRPATRKIKPEPKKWWVERLIDGTYEQLQQELTEGWVEASGETPGHAARACCLGVLTGVAIEHGCEDVRWSTTEPGKVEVFDEEADSDGEYPTGRWVEFSDNDLPYGVEMWAFGDWDGSNPFLTADDKAITLNDEKHWSFAEIAEAVKLLPEHSEVEVR
jgi:hypothetical protein